VRVGGPLKIKNTIDNLIVQSNFYHYTLVPLPFSWLLGINFDHRINTKVVNRREVVTKDNIQPAFNELSKNQRQDNEALKKIFQEEVDVLQKKQHAQFEVLHRRKDKKDIEALM
jgi:hypothetical protein